MTYLPTNALIYYLLLIRDICELVLICPLFDIDSRLHAENAVLNNTDLTWRLPVIYLEIYLNILEIVMTAIHINLYDLYFYMIAYFYLETR